MSSDMIGRKIYELRKAKHITQEELGKAIGVSMQAVSRWECGGAPDIGVLPLIADYFQISLDVLFGRALDSEEVLEKQLYHDLWRTGDSLKVERACRYGWAMFKGMSGMESFAGEEYGKVKAAETVGTLARLTFNTGYIFMNATEQFHYFLALPEPREGYNIALAELEEYTRLFRLLADPHRLKLLTYICSCRESLISVPAAAEMLELCNDEILSLLEEFCELEWVLPESVDMGQGPVRIYRPGDNMALLPLLCFAREFIANPKLFYLNNYLRTKPMLSDMLSDAQES